MSESPRTPFIILLGAALGSTLLSSSFLAGALLLLAITGGWVIATRRLPESKWTPPKELRLIHFGFWFFVLASAFSWVINGLEYDGFKALGTHARLLIFWPLAIALTWAGLRARHFFLLVSLIPLAAATLFLLAAVQSSDGVNSLVQSRFGGGINPILFGNLALLGSSLTLVSGLYFLTENRKSLAVAISVIAVAGILVSLLSGTRSNYLALPLLLTLPLFLIKKPHRLAILAAIGVAIVLATVLSERAMETLASLGAGAPDSGISLRLEAWSVAIEAMRQAPWFGNGPGSFGPAVIAAVENGQAPSQLIQCCTGHAHNDAFQALATRGIVGLLSLIFLLAIPLVAFARQINHPHTPAACLAVAGVMVSVGYFTFGLTEATFERSLFLTFYLATIAALAAALFNEILCSFTLERSVTVTATVITKNEEDHIAECLTSARLVADEIIVLDSGSTDKTVEIARQYADVVEITDWPGFGIQKQRALERATGDWVLSIDADERITQDLAREINHHLAHPDADAYKLPWAVTLYGTRLDFGRSGRAPLRLFRREGVRFSDAQVHERILIPKGRIVKSLRGRLTHYTHRNFGHSLEKSAKYAWLGSNEKARKGKKTRTLLYPTLRGMMTFLQVYLIRGGFLDGSVGYLMARIYAQDSFNKYAGLWTLTRKPKEKNN